MNLELEPTNSTSLALAPPPASALPAFANDGWDHAAEEARTRIVKGDILRFKNGVWFSGRSPNPLDLELVLAAGATTMAWLKWQEGKPTYVPADARGTLPERATLGDTDPAAWPVSKFTGKKEDVWA